MRFDNFNKVKKLAIFFTLKMDLMPLNMNFLDLSESDIPIVNIENNPSDDSDNNDKYQEISEVLDKHIENKFISSRIVRLPLRYDTSQLCFEDLIKYDLIIKTRGIFKKPLNIRTSITTDIKDLKEFNDFMEKKIDICDIVTGGFGYSRWWLYRHHNGTLWRVSCSSSLEPKRKQSFSSSNDISNISNDVPFKGSPCNYCFEEMTVSKINSQYPAEYDSCGVQKIKDGNGDVDPDLPDPIILTSEMVSEMYEEYLNEKERLDEIYRSNNSRKNSINLISSNNSSNNSSRNSIDLH